MNSNDQLHELPVSTDDGEFIAGYSGKGLASLEAVAGGNTVSIADEERPAGGQKRAGQKQ